MTIMFDSFIPNSSAAVLGSRDTAWYACYTRARFEKRVGTMLAGRDVPTYIPTAPLLRQWHDRQKRMEWPLFPGYVFAYFPIGELQTVLTAPGVVDVVRFGDRPAAITDEEISNIRRFAAAVAVTGSPPPAVTFQVGQRVRIVDGPFEGVLGVVVEARNHRRVLVGLEAIGMGFELSVPITSVKALH